MVSSMFGGTLVRSTKNNVSCQLLPKHGGGSIKLKVERCHVSNIQQLHDVIMEERKRIPATSCASLVLCKSMARRFKEVLDNNGARIKY